MLEAPPGAGKTTLVPVHLLGAPWLAGRTIVMLEPRRLAARAAARRIAALLGEPVGRTAGYAMRFERAAGPETRLLVVTEGVLVRRLQDDPALEDVGLVILDELHERSLDADLALALALEVRGSLRPDLRLLAMSATLDGASVADVLGGAPVVRSDGRQFPVEVVQLGLDPALPVEERTAEGVREALARTGGDVLAFLPGGREIERTRGLLTARLPAGPSAPHLLPLYGDLPAAAQDVALAPAADGRRKVVLATNIAETSLTIGGITCVVDGGLERRPRFSPRTGMTRLVTAPVSRASAEQRRGRAGRLGPGLCLRVWSREEERALAPHRPAEIEEADLSPLALELAAWGVADPARLTWLTPPPAGAFAQARRLLTELGALDEVSGTITAHGRRLAGLPLHPRLAHAVIRGAELSIGPTAVAVAALLAGRDRTARGAEGGVDITPRVMRLAREASGDTKRVLAQIGRLAKVARGGPEPAAVGPALALAYPDRVAQRRPGKIGAFRLANGRGAILDASDPLAGEAWLAAAELGDFGSEARIRAAASLDEAAIGTLFADRIAKTHEVALDARTGAVVARTVTRLGELTLRERPDPSPDPGRVAEALLGAVLAADLGPLPWTPAARQLQARVAFLRRRDPEAWPDLADPALAAEAGEWLLPHLIGRRRLADLATLDLTGLLMARVGPERRRELDRLAPTHMEAPGGSRVPIDYAPDAPTASVRLQEMFGSAATPAVDGGRTPLVLHLLSPAARPVAVTRDLAGFWREGYVAVRKEMRGQYPRHPWPEDPLAAAPTTRAKPRR